MNNIEYINAILTYYENKILNALLAGDVDGAVKLVNDFNNIIPRIDRRWEHMSVVAWNKRKNARVLGKTAVGAAVYCDSGKIYGGCNLEHRFRSHDIHAETNVLSTLASNGDRPRLILIVANREQFTPCGSCMDWIFELGGPECLVGFQNTPGGKITKHRARELMPFYPR